jgi:hypothetical protein
MRRAPAPVLLTTLAVTLACPAGGDDTTDASSGATTGEATSSPPTTTDPGEPPTSSTSIDTGSDDAGTADTDTDDTGPAGCGDTPTNGTVVRTEHGPIEGVADGDVLGFLGVRYAAPPIGDLRLRPPSTPACVPEVQPASAYGPICPQLLKDKQGQLTDVLGDEDCLTLNVWTPASGPGTRPVLVFVHGGGNSVGSGSDELYTAPAWPRPRTSWS